jgi:CheY-like chemotaxis protein
VGAALESVEPQVRAAGHRLVVRNDEELTIDADATRIVQVLTNLLNNAVKFTPPGGELQVSTEAGSDHVVIRVRDSGVGISPESLPHIFEMFHQGDSGAEPGTAGLGIGLTLSKQLVELHGGTLHAMSDGVNRGAEFLIRLPLAANVSATPVRSIQRWPKVFALRLRVLVVEDSVDSAEMLRMLVDLLGHDVRVAHNGFAALSIFDEFRPDVVLLDIGLPGMNGYDVAREMRRRSDTLLHLVAITGWGQDEDRRRAREAGFDRHITKPADPELLEQILAQARTLTTVAPATRHADLADPGWHTRVDLTAGGNG